MNNVRPVNYGLIALLVLLQYPLWFGGGGYINVWQFRHEIDTQKQENHLLRERNRSQAAEVVNLQQGLDAIEERARTELGMVKKGETFFQIIETPVR